MGSLLEVLVPHRKHFGLAIGRTSLRGIELDQKGKPHTFAEVLFPEEVFENGILTKKQVFIGALKQLLSVGKFSTPFVGVAFSEVHAYSREYTVPHMLPHEIHEAISWHVKELFPFPEEDLYFDWKILSQNDKEYKLAVVAVQKQVLDPLVEVLITSGLKPLNFVPGASAIARLLMFKPEQYALLVEINRRGAYVTLVEGEKALFTTVINHTADDNTESFLKNISTAILEIEAYYKQKGILKNNVTQIMLTGELADETWAHSMQQHVVFPVTILKTAFKNPAFNKAFAVATIQVLPPNDPNSINLLPASLQKQYDNERSAAFYQAFFLRTTVLSCIIMVAAAGAFLSATVVRQSLDLRVKQLSAQTKLQSGDTQNLLLLNAQAKNIVNLAPLRETPQNKLLVIQSILPQEIILTQWEYDDSKLLFTLTGVSAKREALLLFKQKLEQTEEFTKVTLPLGSLESPENVKFTISFVSKKLF